MYKDDFLSEWGANWNAFLLHNEFALFHNGPPPSFHSNCSDARETICSPPSRARTGHVQFAEDVQIALLLNDEPDISFAMPHEAFNQWFEKPWRLHFQQNLDVDSFTNHIISHGYRTETGMGTSSSQFNLRKAHRENQKFRGWTPKWAKDVWHLLYERQAKTWGNRQEPIIEVKTWLVNDGALSTCTGHRTIDLGPDWEDWYYHLRLKWADQLDPQHDFDVYIVHPEPPRATHSIEMHVAHLILSQIQSDSKAAMITAVIDYGERFTNRLWRAAIASRPQANHHDILERIPTNFKRNTDAEAFAILHDEEVFGDRPLPINHGDGILAYYEAPRIVDQRPRLNFPGLPPGITLPDLTHFDLGEVPDFGSFMAMGPPQVLAPAAPDDILQDPAIARDPLELPQGEGHENQIDEEDFHLSDDSSAIDDPPWYSSITYSLSKPPCTGRTDWSNHDTLHRTIADNLDVSYQDLQTWYPVNRIPRDLAAHHTQAFVALLHWDILPGEHYRVTLLDVEFHAHGPLRQPEVVREARLLPPRFTRSQLLHYLGLNRYCDQTSPQGCLLWINERIQLTQHVGFLQVQNGDYVKIAVPPSNALEPSIATRAAAAVCHRGHSLNDVVIWHLTTGLSHEDEILLPLQHPGNTDDLSLMQIHTSLVVPHYEFDPQKPWRNQLFELWKQGLRTDETNSALPRIATHFLDHRKIFRNDVRRIVELSPNFEEWETTIGQAWVDRLDASIGYRIDCVFPHPLTMDHGLIGYILILRIATPPKRLRCSRFMIVK